MERDDSEPPRPLPLGQRDLSTLAVSELEAYITALEAEIVRVRAAIAAKRAHRSEADTLFKIPS